jgi:hypothetical protein
MAGARATNVVEIRATGIVEACTTSTTAGTPTGPNYTAHLHVGGVTVKH